MTAGKMSNELGLHMKYILFITYRSYEATISKIKRFQ